jgi:ABC-2 type transport system permease protein
MPTNAGQLIYQPTLEPGHLLTQWQGFAAFAGWTALFLAIAAVLFVKRDA